MKYIDAEKLIAEVERLKPRLRKIGGKDVLVTTDSVYKKLDRIIYYAKTLQQSKEALELEMCAEYWWEERGWIMIPPNTTLKGIESLLEQVKKKLQQEQPEVDLEKEIDEMIRSVFYDLNGIAIVGTSSYADVEVMVYIARHFYELARRKYEK